MMVALTFQSTMMLFQPLQATTNWPAVLCGWVTLSLCRFPVNFAEAGFSQPVPAGEWL